MAHLGSANYAAHGHDARPYNAARMDDPMASHIPQRQFSEDALADALAGIEISKSWCNRPESKELVVDAIEVAASALRDQASALHDQISENKRLRSALRVREWDLQNNQRSDQMQRSSHFENQSQGKYQERLQAATSNQSLIAYESGSDFPGEPYSSLTVHPNVQSLANNYCHLLSNGAPIQQFGSTFGVNGGVVKKNSTDGGLSCISSPTMRSLSPVRRLIKGELGPQACQLGAVGNFPFRQELVKSALRPHDEIEHLKKVISECMLKEMQLVHENHILEQRLSELRLSIEKYQQALVDVTSRESSVRQDILEKNARLSTEIRAAMQDINFYASSLMPLLVEYSLQPATHDPLSIVGGIKALVQHLQQEARKNSLPSNPRWRDPQGYQQSQHGVSSPVHPSWFPKSPQPHGFEIVPQRSYFQPESGLSPSLLFSHNPNNWETNPHYAFRADVYNNENSVRSAYPARVSESLRVFSQRIPMDSSKSGVQQINDYYNNADEESDVTGHAYGPVFPERSKHLSSKLPTVREESTLPFSDDYPLPGIEDLGITGEAILGSTIGACGHSINGTYLCHFQWVRHHQDGSSFHIPGASQTEYTVTADDVNTRLSLECTPMDDRNRNGEMVQAFVNNNKFITIDQDMNDQIQEFLESGKATFDVKLVIEDPQELSVVPAVLYLKKSLYELRNGNRLVGSERYASESAVEIKVGKDARCAIFNNAGAMHLLDCPDNRARDLLVLTMRGFIKSAIEEKEKERRPWSK